ncbi:MAG: nucleotidyltransferase domain-containing protein [candidate division WOR-3 bacterium]
MNQADNNAEKLSKSHLVQLEAKKLQIMLVKIVEALNPRKIILFGSRAEWKATDKSDIDLLVIRDSPIDWKIKSKLSLEVSRPVGVPVQLIPITNDFYEETKDVIGGIAYPATKYGVVIYEKS